MAVQQPSDTQMATLLQSQTEAGLKFFGRLTLLFIYTCNNRNSLALQTRHLKTNYSDVQCSLLISRMWILYGYHLIPLILTAPLQQHINPHVFVSSSHLQQLQPLSNAAS